MRIVLSESAARDIKSLPKQIQRHVIGVLQRAKINPWKYARKIVGTEWYRLRAGEYRIIVKISGNIIYVLRVGHRKNVYRGMS
ncbi:MAG: type II toxin-antitoxin system RelE/ParE family toxin [Candidatus Diapherotrites archaeon]|nr:type II toxin-antitoxin system RelE/ParE family toxin [Candidatus Diapherotrites archaeon]